MAKNQILLSVPLKGQVSRDFHTFPEVRDWLKAEHHSLSAIFSEFQAVGENPSNDFLRVFNELGDISRKAEKFARSRAVSESAQEFLDRVLRLYDGNIESAQGESFAAALEALKRGEVGEANRRVSIALELDTAVEGFGQNAESGIQSELENAKIASKRDVGQISKSLADAIHQIEQLRRSRAVEQASLREFTQRLEVIESGQLEFINAGNSIIQAAQNAAAALQEQLGLKFSANYWDEKRKKHLTRFKVISGITAVWLVISVWVLAGTLTEYRERVLGADSVFDLLPYLPSNVLLITLFVWGLRVLVRQGLSETHLATRAEEKSTLIQTYLALINEGAVEREDRSVFLGPAFSLSQDGVVQEDGLPQGAILNILTGRN